jgi:hypothetical protein
VPSRDSEKGKEGVNALTIVTHYFKKLRIKKSEGRERERERKQEKKFKKGTGYYFLFFIFYWLLLGKQTNQAASPNCLINPSQISISSLFSFSYEIMGWVN